MATFKGIDVSKYQAEIDWQAVKNSGIEFAILRVLSSNSGGPYIDPYFEKNYAECKRLGISVGAYYYTYATTIDQANKELDLLKPVLEGKTFEYPIAVDVEDNSLRSLSTFDLSNLVLHALHTLWNWGLYPIWYTYHYYRLSELDPVALSGYDLWIADYRGKQPEFAHSIWQYSSSGSVNGINGPVDMNYCYKDYPAIIKEAGRNGLKEDKPMEFIPISGMQLVVTSDEKPACEIFSAPDVNTCVGRLQKDTIHIIEAKGDSLMVAGMEGVWYQIEHGGVDVYVLALPDRCLVEDVPMEPEEPKDDIPAATDENVLQIYGANTWQRKLFEGLAGMWGLVVG